MAGAILVALCVRLAGFACSVLTSRMPLAALAQYLLLATTISGCVWMIARHVVIEPPTRLMEGINALTNSLARLVRRPLPT
jgi:lipopolysaccharide export system permease protein